MTEDKFKETVAGVVNSLKEKYPKSARLISEAAAVLVKQTIVRKRNRETQLPYGVTALECSNDAALEVLYKKVVGVVKDFLTC